MKKFKQLLFMTITLAINGFAGDPAPEQTEPDMDLSKGGVLQRGSEFIMENGAILNIQEGATIDVYGTISGEGAINGDVKIHKGTVHEFSDATQPGVYRAIVGFIQKSVEIPENATVYAIDGDGDVLEGTIEDGITVTPPATVVEVSMADSKLFEMNEGDYAVLNAMISELGVLKINGQSDSPQEVKSNLVGFDTNGEIEGGPGDVFGIQILNNVKFSGSDSKLENSKPFVVGSLDEENTEFDSVYLPEMSLSIYPKASMTLSDSSKDYKFEKDATVYQGGKMKIEGKFNLPSGKTFRLGATLPSSKIYYIMHRNMLIEDGTLSPSCNAFDLYCIRNQMENGF